ncbi:MAG: hypothetical protein WDO24_06560 [Pseudomonadota bacterium]
MRAIATLATFSINFGLLFLLLGRIDMSVMVPIAVGLNLICASVLSILVSASASAPGSSLVCCSSRAASRCCRRGCERHGGARYRPCIWRARC